ncbi:similar to Saccharomyces cerevisiae YPL050C MNN9 Subunit of Golgi mannosyltransferase complex also containing Anp1p [Maudiozyma saulgeensis]|uniref:Similar to Saccharomyces cerevisiae YPL050C MNN9 Subunit of Golgi mannosyltransferase complex also containing Anp1p n=1 Tax=Maudiozyma saulgeensis TaxID=1789683 RepID=A0A1X7R5G1_9SACH|nr:similar to Saccharomyces cerevisiae YPL050C MNN9 Subunit of Golgi mannosyltransferase complex also containing Anp1p [Kazachstania saulgeensis]
MAISYGSNGVLSAKYFIYLITFISLCLLFFKFENETLRTDWLFKYNIDSYNREKTYYFPFSKRFKLPKYSYKKLDDNSIPDSGRVVEEHIMHYNLDYLSRTDIINTNNVLILTIADTFNEKYWDNLLNLSFDKKSLELGFMVLPTEDGDNILKQLESKIKDIQNSKENGIFKKITILRANSAPNYFIKENDDIKRELTKRKYMAALKNELVTSTIGPENRYILWLGSEITETPQSLIEDLISAKKPVVTANIQKRQNDNKGVISFEYENSKTWIENNNWRSHLSTYPSNFVVMEGIGDIYTGRVHIDHLMKKNNIEEFRFTIIGVDSVSMACTLIQSDVHRDGAMFPNFPFYHFVDTEGFSKMVKRLNYNLFALPNYIVYHS